MSETYDEAVQELNKARDAYFPHLHSEETPLKLSLRQAVAKAAHRLADITGQIQ